ncbi:hypothetical protein S40285_09831 [Stachybotrys chlorohalonatus IBT 40285]|uniref:Uncharacterized protein n=1 Tax=Stachybotrys chlorohalonatus (strain IBT 40285) TaxID=1283841 RepID=A0A084QU79_STAC4|nr:hypothetical protein S40285_09831 [Stachybotrys chlorohalonata IBT 40285]
MLVLNNDVNVRMRAALLKWQKVAEGHRALGVPIPPFAPLLVLGGRYLEPLLACRGRLGRQCPGPRLDRTGQDRTGQVDFETIGPGPAATTAAATTNPAPSTIFPPLTYPVGDSEPPTNTCRP